MRYLAPFVAALLCMISAPALADGDLQCTITTTQTTSSAGSSCTLDEAQTGKAHDMFCTTARVRVKTSTSAAATAGATDYPTGDAYQVYRVDPRYKRRYITIYPEAAGSTTCYVYQTVGF